MALFHVCQFNKFRFITDSILITSLTEFNAETVHKHDEKWPEAYSVLFRYTYSLVWGLFLFSAAMQLAACYLQIASNVFQKSVRFYLVHVTLSQLLNRKNHLVENTSSHINIICVDSWCLLIELKPSSQTSPKPHNTTHSLLWVVF